MAEGEARTDTRRGRQGPYLAAAVLCERVIEGVDGSISLIGIYDSLATAPLVPSPPRYPDAFATEITLVLMLRAGGFTGDYPLTIEIISPDGRRRIVLDFTVPFAEPAGIANSILDMGVEGRQAGEHWFVLRHGRKELTRIRLDIVVDHDMPRRRGDGAMPVDRQRGATRDAV